MSVTGYAFPWDFLGDPEAAPRAATLGVDAVALAATYHATRVASPLHPLRRVTDVPYSASYVASDDELWRGHRLTPAPSAWLDDANPFASAQRQLADVGLPVDALIVLTHVDDVGYQYPDLVVRNAFDEPYPYALCPRADDVREYCLTLIEQILRSATCRGVVFEACGPMGFGHAGVHDKTEFAQFGTAARALLSLCFCSACRLGLRARGVDPDDLARRARVGVDEDVASIETALGDELVRDVAAYRVDLSTSLRQALIGRVHDLQPEARVTLHAGASPWATGSFPAAGDPPSLRGVATIVANCWDSMSAESELRSLDELSLGEASLGGYVRTDGEWSDDALVDAAMKRYVDAGMNELHLYHLGLLSRRSLESTHHLVSAFQRTYRARLPR